MSLNAGDRYSASGQSPAPSQYPCSPSHTMQVCGEKGKACSDGESDAWVLEDWDIELSDEDEARLLVIEKEAPDFVLQDDDPDLPTPLQSVVSQQSSSLKAEFFQFYQECISGGDKQHEGRHWTLNQRMPRAGKDKGLDKIIAEHGVDRRQASSFWREFKENKGVVKMKITHPQNELLSEYERRTEANAARLVESVIDCVYEYDFNYQTEETKDFFGSLMKTNIFSEAILNYASCLNGHLSKRSSGATASQIDGRTLSFKTDCYRSALTFIPAFVDSLASPESIPSYVLHEWMWQVILFVNDQWAEIIVDGSHTGGANLVSSLTDTQIDELLKDSKGTVYYVAGWLLYTCIQLLKRKQRDQQGNCHHVVWQFIETNTVAADVAGNDELLPSREVEHRETHYGAMQRVSHCFFHFVLYMEALYVANLTVANGIRYRGMLLQRIDDVIEKSEELRSLFSECVPEKDVNGKSPVLAAVHRTFLKKYSKMRARPNRCACV